jgi:hypothetical protein
MVDSELPKPLWHRHQIANGSVLEKLVDDFPPFIPFRWFAHDIGLAVLIG